MLLKVNLVHGLVALGKKVPLLFQGTPAHTFSRMAKRLNTVLSVKLDSRSSSINTVHLFQKM